jgi:probable HAF family extracellular repeat protein
LPFVNHAFEVKKSGAMTDLGSLAGDGDCSLAPSVNDRGEIAGSSENGVVDPLLGLNELRAVRWKDGTMQDLGTLPGGSHSMAAGINNHGQVVGFALNGTSDPCIHRFLIGVPPWNLQALRTSKLFIAYTQSGISPFPEQLPNHASASSSVVRLT